MESPFKLLESSLVKPLPAAPEATEVHACQINSI